MPAPATRAANAVLISHGFQSNYERGFANGLADVGIAPMLLGSDTTDAAHLRAGVDLLNLRGSQDPTRPRWQKLLTMLRYHVRLLAFVGRRRPAVAHVIGLLHPPLLCGVLEGLWFRLFARRYVLTVHDLLPHDRHTRWNRLVHGIAYRLPHRLVVHTAKAGQALVDRHGVAPARVHRVEHGLEPLSAPPPTAPQTERPRLLFFGHIAHYKGLDLLLDALDDDLGGDVDLHIVGMTRDAALKAALQARSAGHRWAAHIHWRDGFVPEAAVPAIFASADALVLPYRHIDQSGVLFQAFRFGVPIVATRVGSFADYVPASHGELCEPGNAVALRAAIGRLLQRRHTLNREALIAHGRQYEWQATLTSMRSVYDL